MHEALWKNDQRYLSQSRGHAMTEMHPKQGVPSLGAWNNVYTMLINVFGRTHVARNRIGQEHCSLGLLRRNYEYLTVKGRR